MQQVAVITGDIVGSRKIADKSGLLASLHEGLEVLRQRCNARAEIYRGDAFQVLIPAAADSVLAAVLLRAVIISHSPSKKQPWDARIAIGIGAVDLLQERIAESSGEAFVLSGRGLDQISKSGDRLGIFTDSPALDRQLALLTRLVDDIISHWSHYSAEVVFYSLLHEESQQALARRLGRSQPTIHTRLATAKLELVKAYIEYTGEVLSQVWKQ